MSRTDWRHPAYPAKGAYVELNKWTSVSPCDLAYLPLAHIMEMAAEVVILATGGSIGYGSPQTLTDTGLKLAAGCKGDAPTLQPTFMVGRRRFTPS